MKIWKIWMIAAIVGVGVASLLAGGLARAQEFEQVTPEALKKMIESGDAGIVIVDVQPKGVYDLGHVKGAINFPWAQDIKINGNLPKDKTLILYCDCGHEGGDSLDTGIQLKEKWGYSKIKLLEGGWSKWQQLGYPVEKK